MKKLQKIFSALLVVCMVMSLLSVSAFAEGTGGAVPEGNFKCGMELHVHNADCYTTTAEDCTIQQDLACDEHAAHDEDCYTTHVHQVGTCYTVIPAARGELTCTVEGCEHAEDACYNMIPESKTLTCELSTDPQLVCEIELHVHTEECYVEHTHVESCYIAKQICELPVHEKHIESCLTPTGKDMIDAVIRKMTDAPELQAMQDARGITYADGTEAYPTADAAAAGYKTFIDTCFAEREAALKAYQDMPAELKSFVPEALVTKLTAELDTIFNAPSASITKGENGYNFQTVYSPAYEMSHHWVANADGSHAEGPQTFILVEADESKSWTMDGPYAADGTNNYELAYCSDIETAIRNGIHYKRINLEDSTYYGEDAAEQIRAIVLNSYPFVTLETMKAFLKAGGFADADALNRSEIIAAVQTAVWYCANSDSMQSGFGYLRSLDLNNFPPEWGSMVHNHSNEMYEWWNVGNRKYYVNAEAGARIDALVAYLLEMAPAEPEPEQIVITEVKVVGKPTPVLGFGGLYEVALKVVLNSTGSGKVDDLTLTATVGTGVDATVVTMDVVDGQAEYYMLVPAQSGDEITVEVSGTQTLPRGVYFYEPEPADVDPDGPYGKGEPDGVATAREASQNLVGVAMGATPVYAADSVLFETDEVVYATGELQVQKVDGWGTPLTGAEFTLHADVDNDGDMDPVKTYTVNEQGFVVNDYGYEGIVDLIPGITYELTESKAPAGYVVASGAARFEVVMDGENAVVRMISLPYAMSYKADEAGLEILEVVNVPQSSGGGPIITPDVPEEEIEDGDVPLSQLPDEDVPLAGQPEDILDEEVPLAMAPATGDVSTLWLALSALSGTGLAGVSVLGRKKRDEE